MAVAADRAGARGRTGFDEALAEELLPFGAPFDAQYQGGSDWRWRLPGQGEPCGRDPDNLPLRHRVCPNGHVIPYVDVDRDRRCPTCWRKGWLRREASVLAAKLALESERRGALGRRRAIVHVSLNPPPEEWDKFDTLDGFRRMRMKAYRVARAAGLEGGAVVFHRERCADKKDPVTTDGPHFHVLGFGWIPPDAKARTGWVVRNHGVRRGRKSVVASAEYILSHSHRAEGILPEAKSEGLTLTVTWFGRLTRAADLPDEGPFCPLCDRCWPLKDWADVDWVGQGPPPEEPVPVDWTRWRAYVLGSDGEHVYIPHPTPRLKSASLGPWEDCGAKAEPTVRLVVDPSFYNWGLEETAADRNRQYEPSYWPDRDPNYWVQELARRDPVAYRKLLDSTEAG